MPVQIICFTLGPLENNSYLLLDDLSREVVIIDPAAPADELINYIQAQNLTPRFILLTHAHFDHMGGIKSITDAFPTSNMHVGIHPDDLPLWQQDGFAADFGFPMDPGPEPMLRFHHKQHLDLGQYKIEIRHTPGHSPGHVIFYQFEAGAALVGDLIFFQGIGRTDLPGGDLDMLLHSIQTQVFDLPSQTRLLPGHGPETTVEDEIRDNPFI